MPTDGLGSTRQLADSSGAVVGAYTYDVFGSARTHTGVSTEWTYTGEQNDPNGLVYLRARYYDPGTGRFVTKDPWPGLVAAPQSLNPYAYVANNPVAFMDLFGLARERATPTPTPLPWYWVCGPVTPEGCYNPHYSVPSSGCGIDWGSVARAYWEYHPFHLGYRYVLVPAWDFATSRTPACYQSTLIYAIYCGGRAAVAAGSGAGASYAVYTVGLDPRCTALLAAVIYACSQ